MSEKPEVELARLKKGQQKALSDEVFVGFTQSERQEYDARHKRIQTLQLNAAGWGQTSETDTHQAEARQPYRSREENSSQAYADSKEDSREVKLKKPDTE